MAVQDDLWLAQVDSIYLGWSVVLALGQSITSWFQGSAAQANDGSWIVRSVSTDGAVSGFTLGPVQPNWTSSETPNTGITVLIPINPIRTNAGRSSPSTDWQYSFKAAIASRAHQLKIELSAPDAT